MLDLDKARAARDEKDRTPLEVKLGGTTFLAARPLPLATIVAAGELTEGDLTGLKRIISSIFGEEQAAAVLAAGLDFGDLPVLIQALVGGGEGESDASTG